MVLLILEEVDFLLSLFGFNLLAFSVPLLDGFDLGFELADLIFQLGFLLLQLFDGLLKFGLAMLCLQLLSHSKSHGALIQRLVGGDRHLDLITHSEQEEATLWLGQGNLSDNLIEAL